MPLTGDATFDSRLPHSSELKAKSAVEPLVSRHPASEWMVMWDGMAWPKPCQFLREVESALRYGTPTRSDLAVAATVMDAYAALVKATEAWRKVVIRHIRNG